MGGGNWPRARSTRRGCNPRPMLQAALASSLDECGGRAAERRQQNGLRCGLGAVRRGRDTDHRSRLKGDARGRRPWRSRDRGSGARRAVHMRRVRGTRSGNPRFSARTSGRCGGPMRRQSARGSRAIIASRCRRFRRRVRGGRREYVRRQRDHEDCEAAAGRHAPILYRACEGDAACDQRALVPPLTLARAKG